MRPRAYGVRDREQCEKFQRGYSRASESPRRQARRAVPKGHPKAELEKVDNLRRT